MMKPSFIGIQTDGVYPKDKWAKSCNTRNLKVPDCACSFDDGASTPSRYECKLPACAVAAFKNLQIQQIAHTNSITNLEQSIDILNASLATTPESPAKVLNPHHGSIREEVRFMLDALRET